MIDVDFYLDFPFGDPPCWELVVLYYQREKGLPVDRYAQVTGSLREAAEAFTLRLVSDAHGFVRLPAPRDGCIVLMGRTSVHHAGVLVGEGRVLHATRDGVFFEPLEAVQQSYRLVEFWGVPE